MGDSDQDGGAGGHGTYEHIKNTSTFEKFSLKTKITGELLTLVQPRL